MSTTNDYTHEKLNKPHVAQKKINKNKKLPTFKHFHLKINYHVVKIDILNNCIE